MKSIVFFNNKGGVGKTTLLCNLAGYLAIHLDKKVLIVDADPQCNSTSYLLNDLDVDNLYGKVRRETIESFMVPVRRGQGYLESPINPLRSTRFQCDLIPGDPKLALSEDLLATDWKGATAGEYRGMQTTLVFKHLTQLYKDYDYIFFDVGPSLGAINRSVMLSCDYFVTPMSVDVFSLMALDNMNLSLDKWKDGFEGGLSQYNKEESEYFSIENEPVTWKLKFAGYVMQQYKAKTVKGTRVHVNAYEKISKKIPSKIKEQLTENYSDDSNIETNLGEVQNLHSLVPMSQTSKSPIFELKAKDGVVGAHFSKVEEARDIFKNITLNLLRNIGDE
ncbi:ParA family protein [Vibrio fluvialis]|uniref:ParA family protein n=1 Tax=Vibrio fluvialis TaxID=676 RepID=UPI00287A6887|nr:ParA family protein [Vibrio fluvialis]ELG2043304.1 ParA family protein [Vibrio fluvialis]